MSSEFESPQNLVSVDHSQLQSDVAAYLRSPRANALFAEHEFSFLTSIFICFVTIVAGVLLLPTVKWSKVGLGLILAGLTLAPIRERKSEFRRHPDQLKPLICHGVIAKDELGLVLGTFADSDHSQLASVANQLGNIYTKGPAHPTEQQIFDLLRDDAYHPYRRRTLPKPFDVYEGLILFDVQLVYGLGALSPYCTTLHAFVATPNGDGKIMQIPWDVVSGAIRLN